MAWESAIMTAITPKLSSCCALLQVLVRQDSHTAGNYGRTGTKPINA